MSRRIEVQGQTQGPLWVVDALTAAGIKLKAKRIIKTLDQVLEATTGKLRTRITEAIEQAGDIEWPRSRKSRSPPGHPIIAAGGDPILGHSSPAPPTIWQQLAGMGSLW